MRTRNSLINSTVSFVSYFLTILIRFVAQKVFINILGVEYLGINGLFTNIITMLNIAELGFGTAVIYNLYKPLKEKNVKVIQSLMNFYKKTYNIISVAVLGVGLLLIPVLPYIVSDVSVDINLTLIYVLFIADISFSYLFSYKRSILYADQKNYIINVFDTLTLLLLNIVQLTILYFTKNYYLYLIIKIISTIAENVLITIFVNNKYEYLKEKNNQKLDKKIEKDIFKKVKALLFHKIGTFIVLGTDNIIISKFIGIIYVGLYSNYYLIINAVSNLFGRILTSLTPSVGNLLIECDANKNYNVFKKIRFINNYLSTVFGIVLLVAIQGFITIWLGKDYLLNNYTVFILIINFYIGSMRNSYSIFKDAAGIYYEDRFVPLIESLLNIVFSILLLKFFGITGVFLGTFISGMALWCYSYPKFVYKKLFNRSYFSYFKETMGYFVLFVTLSIFIYYFLNTISLDNLLFDCIINIIVAFLISNVILIIIYYKTDNFKYYLILIRKLFKHTK